MGLFQYMNEHGVFISEFKEMPKEEPSYTDERLGAMSRDELEDLWVFCAEEGYMGLMDRVERVIVEKVVQF